VQLIEERFIMGDAVQPRIITSEQFAPMPDFDAPYVELIEGEIIMVGGASFAHQRRSWHMSLYLGTAITRGTWVAAPMSVRVDEMNTFAPDIFWIAPDSPRCTLLNDPLWSGAPDLVIEILSSSTARRDRDQKYRAYERAGVRECWLVKSEADFLEVSLLNDGKCARLGVCGGGEAFEPPALGIAVLVDALFGRAEAEKAG
jgi:Uma2 family endonuclease